MALDVAPCAIGAFIDERRGDLIDLASDLVAARTPNPPGDTVAAATVLRERLRSLAIEVESRAANEAQVNLIARIPGRGGGPTLMLNGHLDTKPPGEENDWSTDPWTPTIRDGALIGLGSADMKGAVAAMVYAGLAVAEIQPRGSLVLAFTADEETGGARGPEWLAAEGLLEADACVIGEPSGIRSEWEAIHLVSRGAAIVRVRVHGTQMHSSLSDRLDSVNASVQMARLMARLADEENRFLTFEPHPLVELGPTVNVGLTASSGLGYGIVPGHAEFMSDIRALPGMTAESIEADVRALLEQAASELPGLEADVEIEAWTPPSEIPRDHPIVKALQSATADVLGRELPVGGFPGGTDAPHFERAGIATVPSFGPGLLTVTHRPNEWVAVDSLVKAAKMYALAAVNYLDG